MSNTLWNQIKQINHARVEHLPLDQSEVVLLPVPSLPWASAPTFWLVAEYEPLTSFTTSLRGNQASRDFITDQSVRFGLRGSDCPALTFDRQERYGARQTGPDASTHFVAQRTNPVAAVAKPNKPVPTNRRGDREENVRLYWLTQTGQSHHVVEYNNLHTVGASQARRDRWTTGGCRVYCWRESSTSATSVQSSSPPTGRARRSCRPTWLAPTGASTTPTVPRWPRLWQVSRAILRAAGFTVPTP